MKKAIIISIIVVSIFAGFCYEGKKTTSNVHPTAISDSASAHVYIGGMDKNGYMDLLAVK